MQSDLVEGSLWRDPPHYFEQIVYPAYVRAHQRMLTDGDVENGSPDGCVERLLLLDSEKMSMDEVFEKCCRAVFESMAMAEKAATV